MHQGRQECRPSDRPATLLSPMVATKACFAPPPPTISRNIFCKSFVAMEICFFPSGPKLVLVGRLSRNRVTAQVDSRQLRAPITFGAVTTFAASRGRPHSLCSVGKVRFNARSPPT